MSDEVSWTTEDSAQVYALSNWGEPYFRVNALGHVEVTPKGAQGPAVDLYNLVQAVTERGIRTPLLLRFNDILRDRVKTIHQAFANSIKEYNYQGTYLPAYPIKVNQQRHVVEVLRQAGTEVSMGLEVGSKPELIAVLAIHEHPGALLLCNGYKDREYIELALLSQKVGRRPIIIIEKLSELDVVLNVATELGVKPELGFRVRLSGKGVGRWEDSGGDRAKFGLSITDILNAVDLLEDRGALDTLSLLHFHLGSQLTAISTLGASLREATQVYSQLKKRCEKLSLLDIGGGLAVDYDGSKTTLASSMNYSLEEYARDVVWTIQEVCKQREVSCPDIISESGRAIAAYHSVLVFDVLGIANTFSTPIDWKEARQMAVHPTVQQLAELMQDLVPHRAQETLHDAMALRSDMLQQFNLGLLSIEDRGLGDQCYWATLSAISKAAKELHYVPEDLEKLPQQLTDVYFCNLSVFQSLPDHWAIDQIFPIMPIHRLTEEPKRRVVIGDITCDSDGAIDQFGDLGGTKGYLEAHSLIPGEPYLFGAFLVGAYQEILGDLHNLFGDTNAIHIDVSSDGSVEFTNVVVGDTVSKVLNYVQYDKESLVELWRSAVEKSASKGDVTPTEVGELTRRYASAFEEYTYLHAK